MMMLLASFFLQPPPAPVIPTTYAVKCFDGNGGATLGFKPGLLKEVSPGGNRQHYWLNFKDGRTLFVPQASCVVEEFKQGQTSLLFP